MTPFFTFLPMSRAPTNWKVHQFADLSAVLFSGMAVASSRGKE
jgi:hypothetical protein